MPPLDHRSRLVRRFPMCSSRMPNRISPGEAQGPELGVDAAQLLITVGRPSRLRHLRPTIHPLVDFLEITACMRRDHDAVVADVEQACFDGDGLLGEEASDVVAMVQDRDTSFVVDPVSHELLHRFDLRFGFDLAVDDFQRRRGCELEASDRRDVADPLVLPLDVLLDHPRIQGGLARESKLLSAKKSFRIVLAGARG